MHSAEWSNKIRARSKVYTVDDPPTAPLPEEHEIEGEADFCNYVEKHDDVSMNQVLGSLAIAFGLMFGFYKIAPRGCPEPEFTLKEYPGMEKEIPIANEELLRREETVWE